MRKTEIERFKEEILNVFEKELYKDSKAIDTAWSVGDGGEYTKEQAEIMAEFYNNGCIDVEWLIDDKKRAWAFNELADLGVISDANYKDDALTITVDKKAILRTKKKYVSIETNHDSGISIEEMKKIDDLINESE